MTALSPTPATDDVALDVVGLVKTFGAVRAVDGISFRLPRGRVLGLLGGNGAGKSTTIGMIMGLVEPTSGTIRILGRDPAEGRSSLLSEMNFESPYVDMPHRLTVRQNLTVFAKLYEVADAKARIAELARDFALDPFLDRRAGALSAGQKTRVALAKALINRPKLLLLDEPTASLDPDTADWIRTRLEDYRRETGASLLMASHNMAEVERLCDDVVILSAGRIAAAGTPEALKRRFGRDGLEEVFLDVARGRGTAAERGEAEAEA